MKHSIPATFLFLTSVIGSLRAAEPDNITWRRDASLARYNLATPHTSRALSPVDLQPRPGVPPVVLADKGQAMLPVVIPSADEDGYYRAIADLLKRYLDAATGAAFAVVPDSDRPRRGLFIGPCMQDNVRERLESVAGLPPEHFLVDCFEGGIILAGRDHDYLYTKPRGRLNISDPKQSRGTLFAVIDFLERFVGVRFYLPGELGTYVPYLNDTVLSMPPVTYRDGPVMKHRNSSYGSYVPRDAKWLGWTREKGLAWTLMMRHADVHHLKNGHTDQFWHEVYAETHPDFFALRPDGTRMTGDRGGHSSQRCYSSEAGFQEHLRIIERYYATGEGARLLCYVPNDKYIYWWPNDGFRGCACSACMALTDPDAPSDRTHSRLIWMYTAKLAEAVKERWPDKILWGSCYSTWYHIPESVELPDNVNLMVTWNHTPECFFKEPRYWEFIQQDITAKSQYSREPIVIWSHYPHKPRMANQLDTPYLAPHVLQRVLQVNRGRLNGVYLNGYASTSFALDGFVTYLYHRMRWNPDLDVDAALDEFCRLMFGPAAEMIKQYFDIVIDRWENTMWAELPAGLQRLSGRVPWTCYYQETYPRSVRIELKDLLAAARTRVEPGTEHHARVSYFVQAIQPFFDQGEYLELGGTVTAECRRLTPAIDGQLDEWDGADVLTLRDNTNGETTDIRTEMFTAYDDERFYVAGRAREPEQLLVFDEKQPRDGRLWDKDSVEIFLCTEQPGMKEAGQSLAGQYHQIILDPLGSVFDGYKASHRERLDASVDLAMQHVVRREENGFVFELSVPFASLGAVPPGPGSHWVVNFFRNRPGRTDARHPRLMGWSPTLADAHDTSRYGVLRFPAKTIWRASFDDFAKNWKTEREYEGVQLEPTVADGNLLLKVKALPSLKKQVEIKYVNIGAKATFDRPVNLQWRFRFNGPGLARTRTYMHSRESNSKQEDIFRFASGSTGSDWVLRIAARHSGAELPSLTYYCFCLLVEPGADFTFEIDDIRVVERH